MKVEIWSDIMCPFCYIGKRNFETALAQFADKESVEVEWKSFQLTQPCGVAQESQVDYLVKRRAWIGSKFRRCWLRLPRWHVKWVWNTIGSVGDGKSEKAHCLIQMPKAKFR